MTRPWMCLAVVLTLAAPLAAQPVTNDKQEVARLRALLEQTQAQLEQLERRNAVDPRGGRQLGGTRAGVRQPDAIVRYYDLSDLFTVAPSYPAIWSPPPGTTEGQPVFSNGPAGPRGGGGMGGMFNVPRETLGKLPDPVLPQLGGGVVEGATSSIDQLIEVIQSSIAMDRWADVGGDYSINRLGTSLLINADEDTHNQVEKLLDLLRVKWGTLRTITVEAWWLWLDDAELNGLLAAPAEATAVGTVDAEAWQQRLAAAAQQENARGGFRARLTCYNSQTVHAFVGGQRLAVLGIEPILVNEEGENPAGTVAYQPQIAAVQDGAVLQVTPMTNASGKIVVLDLRSLIIETLPEAPRPAEANEVQAAPGEVGQIVAVVERPQQSSYRLSTTLRVPIDSIVLAGGMTTSLRPAADEKALYLFVRTQVRELRDDTPQGEPVAAEPVNEAQDE